MVDGLPGALGEVEVGYLLCHEDKGWGGVPQGSPSVWAFLPRHSSPALFPYFLVSTTFLSCLKCEPYAIVSQVTSCHHFSSLLRKAQSLIQPISKLI